MKAFKTGLSFFLLICFFILDKNIAFATEIDGSDSSAQMYPLSERIISNDEPIYDEYGYMLGHSPEPDSTAHDTTDVYSTNNSEEPYSPRTLLPNSVDLSDDIYFPPVGNQNNTGSCVSWATTYYQFTYQVARMNNWNAKLNNAYRFSPKWTYNFTNRGVNGSTNFYDNYLILKHTGAAKYTQFTPTGSNTPSEYRAWDLTTNDYIEALKYRVSNYVDINYNPNNSDTPITSINNNMLIEMKEYINEGHILTFSSAWSTIVDRTLAYPSSHPNEKVIISLNNTNSTEYGHALSIVGYDDNICYDLNGDHIIQNYERGAFKIVNSYGTDYGNNGFIWLMYDALNKKSNATNLNTNNRDTFIEDYIYYKIDVTENSLNLIAEITLNHRNRNEIHLETSQQYSFLRYSGGQYGFSGGSQFSTATFGFDFNLEANFQRRYINLRIEDNDNHTTHNTIPTKTIKVKLIDRTGKTVLEDNELKVINQRVELTYYKIGMVGDVDNDGDVNIIDASSISIYLSRLGDLHGDDLIVADVDGDGSVNIMDVTHLQRYLAGIIQEMNNGAYAYLG